MVVVVIIIVVVAASVLVLLFGIHEFPGKEENVAKEVDLIAPIGTEPTNYSTYNKANEDLGS